MGNNGQNWTAAYMYILHFMHFLIQFALFKLKIII